MSVNIKQLEDDLWDAADSLREGSRLSSQEYCMPVLGLIYLRYAYTRFKFVEKEIQKTLPCRNGVYPPIEAKDFTAKRAIFLPEIAQYDYLLKQSADGSLSKAVDDAMTAIEKQSSQLTGILPKNYQTIFKGQDQLLKELLRIFDNSALDDIQDDVIGRIYEYFLNKFAKDIASDDGVFFTPKSLVRMIVNIIEPKKGNVLDPACGSGGMFVSSGDFVNSNGVEATDKLTFFGQEKVEFNAKLCKMNMAVHGLNANIIWGEGANTFYNDAHKLVGQCDYVMANPPFNVNKVKAENAQNAGRLPFGFPGTTGKDKKEISNANYLWIQYFYAYLNQTGRAGFVMAAGAEGSMSGYNKNKKGEITETGEYLIRKKLIETGHVDVIVSVGNNFFYTLSLACTLWFFDKGKKPENLNRVLFIDAKNYYTAVERNLNEWTYWQLKNLACIVYLYRGEVDKYKEMLEEYFDFIRSSALFIDDLEKRDFLKDCTSIDNLHKILEITQEQIRICEETEKKALEAADRKNKKSIKEKSEEIISNIKNVEEVIKQAIWLTDKFGNGEWNNIPGLCYIATREEIAEKNNTLTPGAYVGVAEDPEEEENFEERMKEIHAEILKLQEESNVLVKTITSNLKELGLEA